MTDLQTRPSAAGSTTAARAVRPGLLLALVLCGQFMAVLDASIVNVAVPTIRTDLHASGAALQLVIAGYTIAYAVLLITGARLGARYGYSRLFQIGLAGFTAASLACGLAPATGWLIAFRLLQGAGSALMVPQVMSLLQRTFTGAARTRALGLYSAVLAGGMAVGQVLGGVLVSADLFGTGWRPVFLVNVPIGLALLAAGARLLPNLPGDRSRGFDVPGLVVLGAALGLLVVPLVLGHELGWPAWGWAMLAASAALFALFVVVERRIARRGGQPLISGRVLRAPSLRPAALAIFMIMAAFAGFLFAFALHQQAGLGHEALRAGLCSAPVALGFGLSSLHWHRLPARLHGVLPVIAAALLAPGYLLLGVLLGDGADIGAQALAVTAVLGLIAGCAYSPLFARALGGVDPADAADASGVMVTVVQLGQVVGVAVLGSVFLGGADLPASAGESGHALLVTTAVIAAAVAVAAVAAARTRRTAKG
ncbi:MFS transporter [Kitasatospora sp. CM 4170]|uniref:MFS transporter n=1 Tax=Kitasatospora aburaviensis TaxID=67265 RepID=A0ABW1EUM8_9ACTN|nr:MFS transporter [Kitasatospora sp. CM 4170]WNM45745.1 MFS transporter [Kitasatospora sp. CM 4170]